MRIWKTDIFAIVMDQQLHVLGELDHKRGSVGGSKIDETRGKDAGLDGCALECLKSS